MKKTKPFHDGRLSKVRYMMNTQPSWEAASYTVKKLVAGMRQKYAMGEITGILTSKSQCNDCMKNQNNSD